MKWIAPSLAYLAVGIGLFIFHSAWGALLGFHLAIIASLLIVRPNISIAILFKNENIKWILLSALLCGSSGITLYLLWSHFRVANDLRQQIESMGLTIANWPIFIAYFTLVNPLVEEYFWRGYLGDKTKSLHISDFLYAGFHGLILINKTGTFSILYALTLLVLTGWLWRQIARADGGLLAPVLGHMAADFTILMAIYKMTVAAIT